MDSGTSRGDDQQPPARTSSSSTSRAWTRAIPAEDALSNGVNARAAGAATTAASSAARAATGPGSPATSWPSGPDEAAETAAMAPSTASVGGPRRTSGAGAAKGKLPATSSTGGCGAAVSEAAPGEKDAPPSRASSSSSSKRKAFDGPPLFSGVAGVAMPKINPVPRGKLSGGPPRTPLESYMGAAGGTTVPAGPPEWLRVPSNHGTPSATSPLAPFNMTAVPKIQFGVSAAGGSTAAHTPQSQQHNQWTQIQPTSLSRAETPGGREDQHCDENSAAAAHAQASSSTAGHTTTGGDPPSTATGGGLMTGTSSSSSPSRPASSGPRGRQRNKRTWYDHMVESRGSGTTITSAGGGAGGHSSVEDSTVYSHLVADSSDTRSGSGSGSPASSPNPTSRISTKPSAAGAALAAQALGMGTSSKLAVSGSTPAVVSSSKQKLSTAGGVAAMAPNNRAKVEDLDPVAILRGAQARSNAARAETTKNARTIADPQSKLPEEKTKKNKLPLYKKVLLYTAYFLIATGNTIYFKKMTDTLANYSWFTTNVTTLVFIPFFMLVVKLEQLSGTGGAGDIPKQKTAVMGMLDSCAGMTMVLGGAYTAGGTQVLLTQGAIPVTIFLSVLLLRRRFHNWQYVGAAVIVGGVALSKLGKSSATRVGDNPTFNAIFASSNLPTALSTIYKEVAFQDIPDLSVNLIQLWVAFWQGLFNVFLCPLYTLSFLGPSRIPLDSMLPSFVDGAKCWLLGENTVTNDCDDGSFPRMQGARPCDRCENAFMNTNAYVLFNILYNILCMLLVKYGTASFYFVINAVRLPLTTLLFASPLIMGSSAVPVTLVDVLALLVVLAGLVVYKYGAKLAKRDEKAKAQATLEAAGIGGSSAGAAGVAGRGGVGGATKADTRKRVQGVPPAFLAATQHDGQKVRMEADSDAQQTSHQSRGAQLRERLLPSLNYYQQSSTSPTATPSDMVDERMASMTSTPSLIEEDDSLPSRFLMGATLGPHIQVLDPVMERVTSYKLQWLKTPVQIRSSYIHKLGLLPPGTPSPISSARADGGDPSRFREEPGGEAEGMTDYYVRIAD